MSTNSASDSEMKQNWVSLQLHTYQPCLLCQLTQFLVPYFTHLSDMDKNVPASDHCEHQRWLFEYVFVADAYNKCSINGSDSQHDLRLGIWSWGGLKIFFVVVIWFLEEKKKKLHISIISLGFNTSERKLSMATFLCPRTYATVDWSPWQPESFTSHKHPKNVGSSRCISIMLSGQ